MLKTEKGCVLYDCKAPAEVTRAPPRASLAIISLRARGRDFGGGEFRRRTGGTELTKEISTSTASTADVIPCVRALTRLLDKTAETDHGVKRAKSVLLEAVQRRFADIDAQKLYTIATMLDPRYKDRYFSEALKPSFHELLLNTLETSHPVPITTSTVEQPSSSKSTDKTPPACSLQAMFAEFVNEVAGHSEQEITIITQGREPHVRDRSNTDDRDRQAFDISDVRTCTT
ncbi:hypothetical protein PAMA_009015 [Pampus argenteus]